MTQPHAARIEGVVLDHVAHAVPRWQDAWSRYAVDLGARWSSGGTSVGFAPAQLRFGNDARLELLMPHDTDANDFLQRFLAHNGPGAHHLTFKVPDLAAALEAADRFGLRPIGVDTKDPNWMEAFLHPKQATGVVVQLAEAPSSFESPPPADFPSALRRRGDVSGPIRAAALRHVAHAVDDLGAATALFGGLLGGEAVRRDSGPGHRSVDVTWGGPLVLRLLAPADGPPGSDLVEWLGGRAGRVHHLALSVDDPSSVSGSRTAPEPLAVLADDGAGPAISEVAPADNLGLRLLLSSGGG